MTSTASPFGRRLTLSLGVAALVACLPTHSALARGLADSPASAFADLPQIPLSVIEEPLHFQVPLEQDPASQAAGATDDLDNPEAAVSAARTGPESVFDPTLGHSGLDSAAHAGRPSPASQAAGVDLTRKPDDLWERIRVGFSMPDLHGPLVVERQTWYTAQPLQLKLMFERSRRYLFHIVEEIEKRGMPTELALLPMVESAFNPLAYSPAHASGLWQFIPSTGKAYNLPQNWWHDARRDIVASTSAALDYLQVIYEMHGDWHLALASYNWGENAVARAVDRNRRLGQPTDYSNLSMPAETRYYVPKLQALKNIIANPRLANIELDPIPNQPFFATITLTRDIDLKLAARLAQMPIEELLALNPAHNRPVVSSAQTPILVLPADRLDLFLGNLATYDKPLSSWRLYEAQRGERLEQIAAQHQISVEHLKLVNGIRGSGRLQSDVKLLVPTEGARPEVIPLLTRGTSTIAAGTESRLVKYTVRRGDTWSSLARRHQTSVAQLKALNQVSHLVAGRSIDVPVGGADKARRASKTTSKPSSARKAPAAQPRSQASSTSGSKAAGSGLEQVVKQN